MKRFDEWNMTVAGEDKDTVRQALRDEIELTVDDSGRVYTEGGQYIADVIYIPENGIGIEMQIGAKV